MHLRTTDKQFAVLAHGDRVEKQKQDLLKYIAEEESHLIYVEDRLIDPTDNMKQMGHSMTSWELEQRLAKILPSNCFFKDNPFNITKKAIMRVKSLTELETIVPYERGIMPEHSVMQLVERELPDRDVINRTKSITRKDLGKYEFVPGVGFVFDDTTVRPGFKRVKQIGREIKRGWRTVLLKLLGERLITISDIERYFSHGTTAEWAKFTGRNTSFQTWN
jgi:hypothetical protein